MALLGHAAAEVFRLTARWAALLVGSRGVPRLMKSNARPHRLRALRSCFRNGEQPPGVTQVDNTLATMGRGQLCLEPCGYTGGISALSRIKP